MSTARPLRIGIVVGEASGDILGAGLIKSLQVKYPNCEIEGIAGPQMQALGAKSLFQMEELAVMGLFEVLPKLKRILNIRSQLADHFIANPPDVFVGIDAPDFNLGLELKLKKAGIKTVHYVSPSVWAWKKKRIFKIAKATDMVLSLFPFEKAFYDEHKVPCTFVGHTLADQIPVEADRVKARTVLGLEEEDLVLAMLPGSRAGEIGKLSEPFLGAVKILLKSHPELKVLVPVINKFRKQQFESILEAFDKDLPVRVVYGHSRDVMTASNAVMMASGTATLEGMLCKRPLVVAYKFNRLSYYIFKVMIRGLKYFSLPNLLADKPLVKELLQDEVEPEVLAAEVSKVITTEDKELLAEFTRLHQSIRCNASDMAADAVLKVANP